MARQFDVQYLGGYIDGSAARKLEMPKPRKATRKKHTARNKRIVVYVDPLAILGILVAGIMMVLLIAGVVNRMEARQELAQMDAYVQSLRRENVALEEEYEAGYDLRHVEQTALALGMVPMDQIERVSIHVPHPVAPEPSGWEQIRLFLAGLFA